jgi:hypothetical protein
LRAVSSANITSSRRLGSFGKITVAFSSLPSGPGTVCSTTFAAPKCSASEAADASAVNGAAQPSTSFSAAGAGAGGSAFGVQPTRMSAAATADNEA